MDKRDIFLDFFINSIKYEMNSLRNKLDGNQNSTFDLEDYNLLGQKIDDEGKEMICSIVCDILTSYTHSVMAMFDNATDLSDSFLIDVIDYENKESLTDGYDAALHEDFMEKILDSGIGNE